MLKRLFVFLLGLAAALPALPQGIPNFLPANTVVGRLASNPGPTAAIPFATLAAQLGVGSTYMVATSISGTNSISGVTSGAPALATNQTVIFIPANTNTGATTFNRDTTGAVNVFFNGVAMVGGELKAGVPVMLFYDGTQYNLAFNGLASGNAQQQGSVVAASTTNLDTGTSFYQQITGTTTITGVTLANGHIRFVEFSGILTLTNGASLVLPGGANITTAAGDTAIFVGEASGVVRCVSYTPATGKAVVQPFASSTGNFTITLTGFSGSVTGTAKYSITNNVVALFIPVLTGTSNATTMTGTGLPAAIQPTTTHGGLAITGAQDNSGQLVDAARADIASGTITFYPNGSSASSWTNTGTKGLGAGASIVYTLD